MRVSNELGAGKPGRARLAVQTSMSMALVLGAVLAAVLLALRTKWALVFADASAVQLIHLVAKIMPLLVVSQFGVGLQAILSGEFSGARGSRWRGALSAAVWLPERMGFAGTGATEMLRTRTLHFRWNLAA